MMDISLSSMILRFESLENIDFDLHSIKLACKSSLIAVSLGNLHPYQLLLVDSSRHMVREDSQERAV